MLGLLAFLAFAASPLLPVLAKCWQSSSIARLRDVGRAIAPYALWVAFNVSLLGMGGIALMRFPLDGPMGTVSAFGFVLLQPVAIVLARRIAREGEAPLPGLPPQPREGNRG